MSERTAQKLRVDVLLVDLGLAPTREKAQAIILTGNVLVDDHPVDKPGMKVSAGAAVRIRGEVLRFVGRGGEKLEGALDHFLLDVRDAIALDIGASTGGFTDCLLQRGAQRVYAVDVGYNQLDLKLRNDPRVIVMERVHAKNLGAHPFDPPPSFATVDVSFISARKVLEHLFPILAVPSTLVVLVKPQFELEREQIGKGGVVRDESAQMEAVTVVREFAESKGYRSIGVVPSTLRGGKKGNQEYFLLLVSDLERRAAETGGR